MIPKMDQSFFRPRLRGRSYPAGGAMGAGYVTERHPELFKDAGLVLNEGGGIRVGEDGRTRVYNVSVAEKTPL